MDHILIVDDDIHIGNMLEEVLLKEGFAVLRAYSGTEALLLLTTARPNLVLLDLMLPGLSGEEVLKKLQGIPVIVISAKVDVDSKVELLLSGAADYVTKPFEIRELLARIQVVLRGEKIPPAEIFSFSELRLNTETKNVFFRENEIHLTRTEYGPLAHISRNIKPKPKPDNTVPY